VLALTVLIARYIGPAIVPGVPEVTFAGMAASVAAALLLPVWWLLFSRAPWGERVGAIALIALVLLVVPRFVHPSSAGGAMGVLPYMLAVPLVIIAFGAWAVLTRHVNGRMRWVTMVAAVVLAAAPLTLIRTGGFTGSFDQDLSLRWSPTPEDRLLAEAPPDPTPAAAAAPAPVPAAAAEGPVAPTTSPTPLASPAAATPAAPPAPTAPPTAVAPAWAGFRGTSRDSVVHGTHIATDWAATPPKELWKRPVGPGWSSFAVAGGLLYTQEQRGEDEIVGCYRLSTGAPVWLHRDRTRFWESNAGAGPRATPLVHDGRVYTLGATGHLTALDAATGAVVWTRDAARDTGA
jgi:outer membrane protein assembly factor BamB